MQLLDNEFNRLSGRRSEQRSVRKHKLAAKERMRPDLADLKVWLAGDYTAFPLLDEPTQRMATEAHSWTVGESRRLATATVNTLFTHIKLPPCRPAVRG